MGCSRGCYSRYFNHVIRINFVIGTIAILLYILNNKVMKPSLDSYFLNSHFNDVIGGLLIVAFANLVSAVGGQARLSLYSVWRIISFTFVVGLFWEYVTPLYHRGVSDPWDVIAYMGGGLLYWVLARISFNSITKRNSATNTHADVR
ncbi:hypothetical protein NQ117_03375 [Paenibacillus sp. SC116]|uniref:hypothetical protein n=1 Tax=Paenibacillus sp. SC116 TaxID=2968986 RepID=UPI00215A72F9|nr:hypothetical protein [Paenibacillus sp. SC116]MCR8842711.1 hypothetical protein [Paenibacillus sp. SC116]